jgi:hypothetical protein
MGRAWIAAVAVVFAQTDRGQRGRVDWMFWARLRPQIRRNTHRVRYVSTFFLTVFTYTP